MVEILEAVGGYADVAEKYRLLRERVGMGIYKNAIVKNGEGKARVLHGWGENRSYLVGGYCDHDMKSRISLTAHAYAIISGAVEKFPEYKNDIIENILSLDSKYGLLTFSEPFCKFASEVGRLSTITPGTYENSCAYVHAGTFGAMALFMAGRTKDAWRVLEKAMVISHKDATMTTFVMPNSYCKDDYYGFDGESMGDWYTGSGTVLIKNIVRCGFGIVPDLKGVKIAPAEYFPANKAEITLGIKGKRVCVKYENRSSGKRTITLNGNELPLKFNKMNNSYFAELSNEQLTDNAQIIICD